MLHSITKTSKRVNSDGERIRDGADIRIGDHVQIIRSGDNTKVVDVNVKDRNKDSEKFIFLKIVLFVEVHGKRIK